MAGDPRRILLVDDDLESRTALSELFGFWGYEVDVAEDGKRALELARQGRPDVAVMDLGLPDGDALHGNPEADGAAAGDEAGREPRPGDAGRRARDQAADDGDAGREHEPGALVDAHALDACSVGGPRRVRAAGIAAKASPAASKKTVPGIPHAGWRVAWPLA